MATSPQLEKAIQLAKAFRDRAQALGTIDGFRIAFEELASHFLLATDITTEPVEAGGVSAEWIAAPGVAEDRVLLYLHGGGYIMGSMRTHREMISRLSRAAGMRALGLEYRVAPEHPFPAAVEDAIAAYRWLVSTGIDPRKIVIGGDSCGGGQTVATLVALRYLGEPLPAAGVCISAWTDLTHTAESFTTNAAVDPVIQRELLEFMASVYLGGRDRRTPLASPLYADLHGLPPLLILVGSTETMLDDSTGLAERAQAAGVEVTLEVWDDMIHCWPLFASILPKGQQAVERIGAFIREHTSCEGCNPATNEASDCRSPLHRVRA
jgi:epsilon-lactone hydrolase